SGSAWFQPVGERSRLCRDAHDVVDRRAIREFHDGSFLLITHAAIPPNESSLPSVGRTDSSSRIPTTLPSFTSSSILPCLPGCVNSHNFFHSDGGIGIFSISPATLLVPCETAG